MRTLTKLCSTPVAILQTTVEATFYSEIAFVLCKHASTEPYNQKGVFNLKNKAFKFCTRNYIFKFSFI